MGAARLWSASRCTRVWANRRQIQRAGVFSRTGYFTDPAFCRRPRAAFSGVIGQCPINAAGEIEAENLTLACRNAVLNMIELLQGGAGFSREAGVCDLLGGGRFCASPNCCRRAQLRSFRRYLPGSDLSTAIEAERASAASEHDNVLNRPRIRCWPNKGGRATIFRSYGL